MMEELLNAVSGAAWLVYLLTAVALFVETVGVPIPALSVAIAAAALAGNGTVEFWPVVLATIIGGALGGPVGHALGLRRGRPLLEQMGSRVRLTPERLDEAEEQFKRRGKGVVLIRFFVPILPWSAGLFAGMARMPAGTLFLFNLLSITLWALIELTFVAYFSSAVKDLDILSRCSLSGLFFFVVGSVGLYFLVRSMRRRKEAQSTDIPDQVAATAEAGSAPPTTAATPTPAMANVEPLAPTEATAPEPSQDTPAASGAMGTSNGRTPHA